MRKIFLCYYAAVAIPTFGITNYRRPYMLTENVFGALGMPFMFPVLVPLFFTGCAVDLVTRK